MMSHYIDEEEQEAIELLIEDLLEMNSIGAIELSEWVNAQHFIDVFKGAF